MSSSACRIARNLAGVGILAAFAIGCGGGAEKTAPLLPPPPPAPVTIVTTLPDGFYGEFYSANLKAGGGNQPTEWSIDSGDLPRGMNLDRNSGVISGFINDASSRLHVFTIQASTGAHSERQRLEIRVLFRSLKILTSTLPPALLGRDYRVELSTTDPAGFLRLHANSAPLPPGLGIDSQKLVGKPTQAGRFIFTLQLQTTGIVPMGDRTFELDVVPSGSRNEDRSTATQLSSGTYFASISPFSDPVTIANPDRDFYKLTAQPGNVVSVEILTGNGLFLLDSVIEFLDSSGARLNACNAPGESAFTSPCMNDDNLEEFTFDSKLLFKAPPGGPSTFFLHVLDWRGDARPDMEYQLQILGAD